MSEPYVRRPVSEYIDDAASNKPAPGGGSVSALVGTLGMTMAEMALRFTIGKKKFAKVEERAKELLAQISRARSTCLACVDKDVSAYGEVSSAYGLPRDNDEQKKARTDAIQAALKTAMQPPLETFRAIVAAMPAIRECVDIANPNLVSDVGVAAIHARAALQGARMNVEINLAYLKDSDLVASVRDEIESGSARAERLAEETHRLVTCRIAGGE